MNHRKAALALMLLALLAPSTLPASPFAIHYSGRIVDAVGRPLQGKVRLRVKFYRQAEGGTPISVTLGNLETQLDQGLFDLGIPLSTPELAEVFSATEPTWIEITDVARQKTYPRQKYLAVPYALRVPVDEATIVYNADGKLELGAVPAAATADALRGIPVQSGTPGDGKVLKFNQAAGRWDFADDAGAATTGPNGASSLGGAVSVYKQQAGGTLQFRGLTAGDGVTMTQEAASIVIGAAVTGVAGKTGAVALDAADIGETATRKWLTDAERAKLGAIAAGATVTDATSVAAAGALMTSAFTGDGLLSRAGEGYGVVADNSAHWNAAYGWGDHAAAGYLNGSSWAAPGSIGVTTPSSAAFTSLTATGLRLKDGAGDLVSLLAPSSAGGGYTLTLPTNDGGNGEYLRTDGDGVLSWASVPSVPSTTDGLPEGSGNFYYTAARATAAARAAVSGTAPIAVSGAGVISIAHATATAAGAMPAADKAKLDAINTAAIADAYADRLQWDGGATGLDAAAARASLGLGLSATLGVGTTAGTVAAGDHTHATATTSAAGYMSAADKASVDGFALSAGLWDTAYADRLRWDGSGVGDAGAQLAARGNIGLGSLATQNADAVSISGGTLVDVTLTAPTFAADAISGDKIDGGTISNFASTGIDDNAAAVAVTILASGKVGIGTQSPTAKLQVTGGQAVGAYAGSSVAAIDWNNGNTQATSVAAGTLTFAAGTMLDGGYYTLILTNATGGTYALSSADVSTWKCDPACSSSQVQVTAGKHTIVSILKAGTVGYVSWSQGFQ